MMNNNQIKNKFFFKASEKAFEYLDRLFNSKELNQLLEVSVINLSLVIDIDQYIQHHNEIVLLSEPSSNSVDEDKQT